MHEEVTIIENKHRT